MQMHLTIDNIDWKTINKDAKVPRTELWGCKHVWEPGELIQVVAPSGSGKTTFIHILYGMRKDYSGQVLWGANSLQSMDDDAISALRSKHVSVIFQGLRLIEQLTIAELIEVRSCGHLSGNKHEQWLSELGIPEYKWNTKVQQLSMGEQQRVAIVSALSRPFDWLLADEPFSHLDSATKAVAVRVIAERVKELGAGLMITSLDRNADFAYSKTLHL